MAKLWQIGELAKRAGVKVSTFAGGCHRIEEEVFPYGTHD